MLVVITDKSSDKSPQEIRAAVRSLETAGIRVIAVAVGRDVDPDKVKGIPTDGDVIETDNKKDPKDVGEEIMDKVAKGKSVFMLVQFGSYMSLPFLLLTEQLHGTFSKHTVQEFF